MESPTFCGCVTGRWWAAWRAGQGSWAGWSLNVVVLCDVTFIGCAFLLLSCQADFSWNIVLDLVLLVGNDWMYVTSGSRLWQKLPLRRLEI